MQSMMNDSRERIRRERDREKNTYTSPRLALRRVLLLAEGRQFREAAAILSRLAPGILQAVATELPLDILVESLPHSSNLLETLLARLSTLNISPKPEIQTELVAWRLVGLFGSTREQSSGLKSRTGRLAKELALWKPELKDVLEARRRELDSAVQGLGTHGLTADASGALISLHVALKNELQRHIDIYKQAVHKLEELSVVTLNQDPACSSHQRLLALSHADIESRLIDNKSLLTIIDKPTLRQLPSLISALDARVKSDKDVLSCVGQIKRIDPAIVDVSDTRPVAGILMSYSRGCDAVLSLMMEDSPSGIGKTAAPRSPGGSSGSDGYHSDSDNANELLDNPQRSGLINRYGSLFARAAEETIPALGALEQLQHAHQLKYKIIFSIVVLSYRAVLGLRDRRLAEIKTSLGVSDVGASPPQALLARLTGVAQQVLRHTVDTYPLGEAERIVANQVLSTLREYPCLGSCSALHSLIASCCRLAWLHVNAEPPLTIDTDFTPEDMESAMASEDATAITAPAEDEVTRRRRRKWTEENNANVMRAYFRATGGDSVRSGYRQRLLREWLLLEPDINVSEQRLVDQPNEKLKMGNKEKASNSRIKKKHAQLVSLYQNTTVFFKAKFGSIDSVTNSKSEQSDAKKSDENSIDENNHEENRTKLERLDDLPQNVEPSNSFVYRYKNQLNKNPNSSYVPMNIGKADKSTKRTISQMTREYINIDLNKLKVFPSKSNEKDLKFNDRGYYAFKRKSKANDISNMKYEHYDYPKQSTSLYIDVDVSKIRCKEDPIIYNDEHLYEVLNFNSQRRKSDPTDLKPSLRSKILNPFTHSSYLARVNDIISSIKQTIISRTKKINDNAKVDETEINLTPEVRAVEIYDSIDFEKANDKNVPQTAEENEYLTPIQLDYADVSYKGNRESVFDIISKFFEAGLKGKRDNAESKEKSASRKLSKCDISDPELIEPPERPLETLQHWNKNFVKKTNTKEAESTSGGIVKMADRPLPVPIESESFFMRVDRIEAVKLLEGHQDGSFVLRPSSQPEHVYSLSIVYNKKVYNVGIRRRKDGKLALGYSKQAEESHSSVKELIDYHNNSKIILVEGGKTVGATVLRRVV